MKIRKYLAAAAAVGLLWGASACSDQQAEGAPGGDQQVARSTALTDSAGLTKVGFTEDVVAAQREVGSAHVEATVEFSGQQGTFSGDFAGFDDHGTLKLDMSAAVAGQQVDIIVLDNTIYLRGAGVSTHAGKPWVKVDMDDHENPLSALLDAADPTNLAAYLAGVNQLRDRGPQTVDGVRTHHYTATIDTATMMRANSMFAGHDASELGLPDEISTEVWVDSAKLPIKISVSLGQSGSVEAHFSAYGEPISVHAPPASRISAFHL